MRSMLAIVSVALMALTLVTPASANHDNGLGKSQDHLHRQQASALTVSTPEPLTLAAFGVGLLALGLFRRRK